MFSKMRAFVPGRMNFNSNCVISCYFHIPVIYISTCVEGSLDAHKAPEDSSVLWRAAHTCFIFLSQQPVLRGYRVKGTLLGFL